MRRTPLETMTHLPNALLRDPIPERDLVPLDSTPEILMKQLDDLPYTRWRKIPVDYPPKFPNNYPPEFPALDGDSLYKAYMRSEYKVLDWLGDAVIEAVLSLAMYPTLSACTQPIAPPMSELCSSLASNIFLCHLTLLYGLQLHDPRTARGRPTFPKRMGDIFEAIVGVCLQRRGYSVTLGWLQSLFDPWVSRAREQREGTPFVCGVDQSLYEHRMRVLTDVPLAPRDDRLLSLDCLVVDGTLRTALRGGDISAAIGDNCWEKLDVSRVHLSEEYPRLPPLEAVDPVFLTAALTDSTYYLHFGEDVAFNEGFRSLGQHFLHLAATVLVVRLSPRSSSSERDEIRAACTCRPLFALLGLTLNVHRHLRTVRGAADDTCWIAIGESAAAFCALAGVTYLHAGWDDFLGWANDMLSPWILAAAAEQFLGDKGAQSRRMHRLIAEAAAAEKKAAVAEEKKQKREKHAALMLKQAQYRKSPSDARRRYAGDFRQLLTGFD
ncbi:hypothetical protein FB45DRAFT_9501 [Roridomyces roridus]|uniref:RNase III domain-containing protein n=1 Tax=Roridomyces roridus TaxID=1738132 RepID=A0AAD7FYK6_9AGAR|nr:hypothetical protein FB45DRAFT_9501 [Roridomyces roridus]